jgi:hypothetical protein
MLQKVAELVKAASLLSSMSEEFLQLKGDMQKLSNTLSDSVHEATQLTLTHTRLYDSAVEVLQVIISCHSRTGIPDTIMQDILYIICVSFREASPPIKGEQGLYATSGSIASAMAGSRACL